MVLSGGDQSSSRSTLLLPAAVTGWVLLKILVSIPNTQGYRKCSIYNLCLSEAPVPNDSKTLRTCKTANLASNFTSAFYGGNMSDNENTHPLRGNI